MCARACVYACMSGLGGREEDGAVCVCVCVCVRVCICVWLNFSIRGTEKEGGKYTGACAGVCVYKCV